MELVPTFNAAIFVAMTVLLTLLQSLVASQAEVGTEPCTAFRYRSLALGTFQLESISHKDSASGSSENVRNDCFSHETDLAISGLVRDWNERPLRHLLAMSCEKSNFLPEGVTSYRSRTMTLEKRFHGHLFWTAVKQPRGNCASSGANVTATVRLAGVEAAVHSLVFRGTIEWHSVSDDEKFWQRYFCLTARRC
jgi:hypothetical protein